MVEVGGKGQSAEDRRMRVGLYTLCGMEADHRLSVSAAGEADDPREA